jgi:DNA polymerase-3 subunit beta
MKIKTTAEALTAALKASIKPEAKTSIPVLRFAKLSNNTLTMTDLDMYSIVEFKATGKGEFLIPYRQTLDALAGEKGPLEITFIPAKKQKDAKDDPTERVSFNFAGSEFTFDTMRLSYFPNTPKLAAASLTVKRETFKKLLAQTRFAISQQESRYTLNGALLVATQDTIKVIATDGHRLSHAVAYEGTLAEMKTLVARDALDWLNTRIGEDVSIGVDEHNQTFRTGGKILISRILGGQFPNYEAVMPRDLKITGTIPSATALFTSLTRIAKCSDERSGCVTFRFDKESTISASSTERGSASAPLDIAVNGSLKIGLNSTYVLDFLKAVGDVPVEVGVRDPQSSVKFSVEGFDYIVMPMRL